MDDLLSLVRWILLGGFAVLGIYLFIVGIKQVIIDLANVSDRAKIFLLSLLILMSCAFGYYVCDIRKDGLREEVKTMNKRLAEKNDSLEWLSGYLSNYDRLKKDPVVALRRRMKRASLRDSVRLLNKQKQIVDIELERKASKVADIERREKELGIYVEEESKRLGIEY